ncbi:MAG: MFS transporter [Candidatus Dormibacteria bacterium]
MAYAIAAVLAAANLPTPLYPHYQHVDHLSTATLTVVFVAYVVTVAATLTVAGQASDLFGRRAVLLPALGFAILSAACFATSGALGWLVAGRVASGIVSGAVTAAGPAALADLEPTGKVERASTVASAAVVAGLAIGPMVSGLFVRYAPWPDHLVYLVFLGVLTVALAGVAGLPPSPVQLAGVGSGSISTVARIRSVIGRLGQLRRPSVPAGIRPLFVRVAVAFSTGWVGTAMFFALGPTFADLVLRTTDPIVGAAIVFEAFVMSASTQLLSRRLPSGQAMRWGLVTFAVGMALLPIALSQRQPALLVLGAAAAGAGQGLTHRASQAALLDLTPPAARGQTAAAFYLVGYLVIAVVLVSLGFLIDATGPLTGLVAFAALMVSAAAVAIVLVRGVVGRGRSGVTR